MTESDLAKVDTELSAYDSKMCVDCGSSLIPDGGCWFCPFCGYSRCGG